MKTIKPIYKILVRQNLFLLIAGAFFMLTSCSDGTISISTDNANNNYKPTIFYEAFDDNVHVRISLPNGGSKIIHTFNEPIVEGGKKMDSMHDTPTMGMRFLNGDSLFKLVNTSRAKLYGGIYYLTYIFQKNQEFIVFMEEFIDERGFGIDKLLYKGKLIDEKSDPYVELSMKESKESYKRLLTFVSDNNDNEKIELIFIDNDVVMEFYQDNELRSIIRGKYINGKLLMDEALPHYELRSNSLYYSYEGGELNYIKVNEKTIH